MSFSVWGYNSPRLVVYVRKSFGRVKINMFLAKIYFFCNLESRGGALGFKTYGGTGQGFGNRDPSEQFSSEK